MGNCCKVRDQPDVADEQNMLASSSERKPGPGEQGIPGKGEVGALDNPRKGGSDAVYNGAHLPHSTLNLNSGSVSWGGSEDGDAGQVNLKEVVEFQKKEACLPQLGNGCTNHSFYPVEDLPVKQLCTLTEDVPAADRFCHVEKGVDRHSESPEDGCLSTLCDEHQADPSVSPGPQLKTPCESRSQQAGPANVPVAILEDAPSFAEFPASMRRDRKLTRNDHDTAKLPGVENQPTVSHDGEGSSCPGKAKISKVEVQSEQDESTVKPEASPPEDVAPGQGGEMDTEELLQKSQREEPFQSLAKGPKTLANQSHPSLSDTSGEPVTAEESAAPLEDDSGEEDLYRGAEEIKKERKSRRGAEEQLSAPLGDQCTVAPGVGLLTYSRREWKGNTAKSSLVRKGYEVVSQSFHSLRRVRGDNYCALRATLFQVLSQHHPPPDWLLASDITQWPEDLLEKEDMVRCWRFPLQMQEGDASSSPVELLKVYLELLKTRWQEAAQCTSAQDRQHLCEQTFQAGKEEYGLLEALKFLMLHKAVELHECMQRDDPVPVFCWLLFARDSSHCPHAFLANFLSHVGFSGGLEQVEMFLLGYTLQRTLQVYRLYKASTEEFVTYYPDDHKEDWPCVCLVTEDDRHYNIPVSQEGLA